MSFFKHLVRGWKGESYYGHHGKRRYRHHGGYAEDRYEAIPEPGLECVKCKTRNARDARFCARCGNSLQPLQCSACRAEAPPGAKFCPHCGQVLQQSG